MFSVIIPLYNKAPYIEKSIRSVMDQTFQEFELIIVDDGSKDDGWEIVQKLFSSLIPPLGGWGVTQQENSGVSTARNNGVKIAKYDYIAFLDADDWWEPTYLEEMKGLIERYPQAGIYGSSYYKVKNGQYIRANIGVESGFTEGEINYFRVYARTMYQPIWTGAAIIKKNVFEAKEGFKSQLKLGEDFDLWVRVAINYPVVLLNKPLACYNQDVVEESRGVVFDKIYAPETHFIFNMDFLAAYESENPDIKQMMDLLRLYTLERYYLQNAYPELVNRELNKVDFSKQDRHFWYIYHLPKRWIKLYFSLLRLLKKIMN